MPYRTFFIFLWHLSWNYKGIVLAEKYFTGCFLLKFWNDFYYDTYMIRKSKDYVYGICVQSSMAYYHRVKESLVSCMKYITKILQNILVLSGIFNNSRVTSKNSFTMSQYHHVEANRGSIVNQWICFTALLYRYFCISLSSNMFVIGV